MKYILLCILFWALALLGFSAVETQAGPYRVSLETQPRVIPVGQARLNLRITDSGGKPLDDLDVRAIARMPGMSMGEREQRANQVAGQAGSYSAPAAFPMAGAYEVQVKISGQPGESTAILRVSTGQDTGSASGGFSFLGLIPWIIGAALIVYVMFRMRASGQKANWAAVFNRASVGGVLLLAGLLAIAIYAVNKWRRPGSMTPIEAQVMEMNTPAPPGATAVQLSTVARGSIAETVHYSGQAVGFVEQDVNPRVTGVIVSMPVYVGDRVKKGQVLARLDTSQLDPQLAERAAMTEMAARGVAVAASEYEAALHEVAEARSEVQVKEGGVAEAEAMLDAARQEETAAQADVMTMQSEVANAQAEVTAAQQESSFRNDELGRMRQLFAQKAISRSELQQAESDAANALGKFRQAQAMVQTAESKVTAARANARKAAAMVSAAQKRVRQARAEVLSARAAVLSRQKAADAAKQAITRERAGVDQARAGYRSAAAQKGYAELKAEVDGVVYQRLVSPGTLVNPGQTVLKVAQTSPIRLQANVAEADLARISLGAKATVTDRSGKVTEARITSIAPSLDSQVRTGIAEATWANSDSTFLPGQFIEMEIEVGTAPSALSVPIEAIQRMASGSNETFIWVAEKGAESDQYTVHRTTVKTGVSDGKSVEILSGLSEGQKIVVRGGAFLRENGTVNAPSSELKTEGPVIEVSASGFRPNLIKVEMDKPVTLTFIRVSEEGCGTEVIFPDLKITRPLPLNKPVAVTLTPKKRGELNFSCGMNMLKGKLVVQ